MGKTCSLCGRRINDWEVSKTTVVNGKPVHNACLQDATVADIESKGAK